MLGMISLICVLFTGVCISLCLDIKKEEIQ